MSRSFPTGDRKRAINPRNRGNKAHEAVAPDQDASKNFLLREGTAHSHYNRLIGVPSSKSDWENSYRRCGFSEYNPWERENPFLYRGLLPPAAIHIADERHWACRLYPKSRSSPTVTHESSNVLEHTKYWWKKLDFLVKRHYDGVGKIKIIPNSTDPEYFTSEGLHEPGAGKKYREVRVVSQFFMEFDEAMGTKYHDTYLLNSFLKERPKSLEDIFSVFIEMEANRVHPEYCPRCSLPYATTRYCAQGVPWSPLHAFQGVWDPHKSWSKEWYDLVANRGEALFVKATEHTVFGTAQHTQRQVEALMRIYRVTHQRGRANSFLINIRASAEYASGVVKESANLMKLYNEILDETNHPILLTNMRSQGLKEGLRNPYLGIGTQLVPQSVKQLRIDLELDRFRREQREEGVVRVPPKGWNLCMKDLVEYKLSATQTSMGRRVTNWREVKRGLEKSFMHSRRLPKECYIDTHAKDSLKMLRELEYYTLLEQKLLNTNDLQIMTFEEEKIRLRLKQPFYFPDNSCYRWYEIDDGEITEMKKNLLTNFTLPLSHGSKLQVQVRTWDNPNKIGFQSRLVDVTPETCQTFGYQYGAQFEVLESCSFATCAGVDADSFQLLAVTDEGDVVEMGRTCTEVEDYVKRNQWKALNEENTIEIIEKEKNSIDEFFCVLVGIRRGSFWVQTFPECGVAIRLDVQNLSDVKCIGKDQVREPYSWKIPFRNDEFRRKLKQAIEAPWNEQPVAPLIPDRMTPKRMIFGYTQHIANDDFVTSEYTQRLQSKQFHTKPNQFQVLPESYEAAPALSGKTGSIYTHGLPTVDRKELTHGWNKVNMISDEEVAEVEQAIRDISGTRPGNYYKKFSELEKFKLNENWWNVRPYWTYHNLMERSKHVSERCLLQPHKLPFEGKIPLLGSVGGIGDRFQYVMNQVSKGFGIGPTGHSPDAWAAPKDTLGFETERSERLNSSSALLRLFREKLKRENASEAQIIWAMSSHPKELMISYKEWTCYGAAPSPLLLTLLHQYMKVEIEQYNSTIPVGCEKISNTARALTESRSHDTVWGERDPALIVEANEKEAHYEIEGDVELIAQEGLIRYKYVQRHLHEVGRKGMSQHAGDLKTVQVDDPSLEKWCRQSYLDNFSCMLAHYVNRDITNTFLKAVRKSKEVALRDFRAHNRWITNTSLRLLLMECHIRKEDIEYFMAQAPDADYIIQAAQQVKKGKHSLTPFLSCSTSSPNTKTFTKYYHVPSLLKWKGTRTSFSETEQKEHALGSSDSDKKSKNAFKGTSLGLALFSSQPLDNMIKMREVLQNMVTFFGDGFSMDWNYGAVENKGNAELFLEFKTLAENLVSGAERKEEQLRALYSDYCEGRWVPSITETIHMMYHYINRFGKIIMSETSPDHIFVIHPAKKSTVIDVILASSKARPFQYENVRLERDRTIDFFGSQGILDTKMVQELNNTVVDTRTIEIDYDTYTEAPLRGSLGFGDVEEKGLKKTTNTQVDRLSDNFMTKIRNHVLGSEHHAPFTSYLADNSSFRTFIRKVFHRHFPLVGRSYQLWSNFNTIYATRLSEIKTQNEQFRQVYGISDSSRRALWKDDFATYQNYSEKYWREIIRSRKRMMAVRKSDGAVDKPYSEAVSGRKGYESSILGTFTQKSNSAELKHGATNFSKTKIENKPISQHERDVLREKKELPAESIHVSTGHENSSTTNETNVAKANLLPGKAALGKSTHQLLPMNPIQPPSKKPFSSLFGKSTLNSPSGLKLDPFTGGRDKR